MEVQTVKQLQNSISNAIDVLIHKIEPLTKANQANVNITQLLTEFYKTVRKCENYYKNGIFTLNFVKAATFLDHAFYIYAKQVDFLWNLTLNEQRRLLSFEEDSAEKIETEKRLEEKMQKGKRGRKKAVVVEANESPVDWVKVRLKIKKYFRDALDDSEDDFDFDNDLDGTEVNRECMDVFNGLKWSKKWNKLYPKKYITAPYVDSGFSMKLNDDCYYHSNNSANYFDFMFPEIQRKFIFNYTDNKKLETIGCDFEDKALQKFLEKEKMDNPSVDFTEEVNQRFQKYLQRYLIEGRAPTTLEETRRKLCPRRTSIVLTRLSTEIMQQHLDPCNIDQNQEIQPSTSRDDSGFFENNSDDDNNNDDFNEKPCSSLSLCSLTINSNLEENNDSKMSKTLKRRKSFESDETNESIIRKRRKKDLFKWLKTTTVSLKRFEKFFLRNYVTDIDEGEIQRFENDGFSSSSDDDDCDPTDNGNDNHQESPQLNKTGHNDSGFSETLGLFDETTTNKELSAELNKELNTELSTELNKESNNELNNESNKELNNESNKELNNELNNELNKEYKNKEFEINSFEQRERIEAHKRYLEWNQYIKKELNKRSQNEFDIHDYGTKIIDKLSEDKAVGFSEIIKTSNTSNTISNNTSNTTSNNTSNTTSNNTLNDTSNDTSNVTSNDVNSDLNGAEIARYFAAALQLVNTENIKFTDFKPGEVADDLKVILIDRNRHHEQLDRYKNASDDLIKEKVKKISRIGEDLSDFGAVATVKRCFRGYDDVKNVKKYKKS